MTASGLPIAARQRVQSVDVVRGLVMVLMALDHTRDFFTSVRFDPLDLTQTNPALFYTRWITHLCAPAFVFLSGTGAFLSTQRGKSCGELSRFLWTRGLWLIVLELTVVRLAWTFNFNYARVTFVQVIWALGWSMIVLAGLIRLPTWAITAFGLVMVAGHNLLDPITPEAFGGHGPFSYGFWGWLWIVLHVQVLPVAYPLIPWIGVMALGYVFGGIYSWDPDKRRHFLWRLSALVIAGFVVLRYIDRYGDPGYWHPQASPIFTVMSFMNLQKYPPSLLYLMATLGPCFGLLALFERWSGPVARFFMVYGKVPMFYYILHLYLIHALTLVVGVAAGFGLTTFLDPFFFYPPEWGYGLPVVYLAWAAVVLALYLPCRWFARVKATNKAWWLSYL